MHTFVISVFTPRVSLSTGASGDAASTQLFCTGAGGVVLETDVEKAASRTLQTHATECHSISPSSDGLSCLVGTAAGSVWSSDPREGLSRLSFKVQDRHKFGVGVYSMQRCPRDDNLVGVVGCSPLLRLYDLRKAAGGPVSSFAPEALRELTALSISGMDWSSDGAHILLNYLDDYMYEVSVHCQREVGGRAEARYRPLLPAAPAGAVSRSRGGARKHTKKASAAKSIAAQRSVADCAAWLPGTAFVQQHGLLSRRTLRAREVQYAKPQGRSLRSTSTAKKLAALPSCFGWVRRGLPAPYEPPYAAAQRAASLAHCSCSMPNCHNSQPVTHAPKQLDASYVRCFKNRVSSSTIKGVRYMGPGDRFVVSGSDNGTVVIAERSTGNPVHVVQACTTGPANCLAPHPSGAMLLAVGGLDDTVSICEAALQPRSQVDALLGRPDRVRQNADRALALASAAVRTMNLDQAEAGWGSESDSDNDSWLDAAGYNWGGHNSSDGEMIDEFGDDDRVDIYGESLLDDLMHAWAADGEYGEYGDSEDEEEGDEW